MLTIATKRKKRRDGGIPSNMIRNVAHDLRFPRWPRFVFSVCAFLASAFAPPTSADTFHDLSVQSVAAASTGPGVFTITAEVVFVPEDGISINSFITARLLVAGAPVADKSTAVAVNIPNGCCSISADCKNISGWTKQCGPAGCPGNPSFSSCLYRAPIVFTGINASEVNFTVVVDPDADHVQTSGVSANDSVTILATSVPSMSRWLLACLFALSAGLLAFGLRRRRALAWQ